MMLMLIASKVLICSFVAGQEQELFYLVNKGKEICGRLFPSQGQDSLQTLLKVLIIVP